MIPKQNSQSAMPQLVLFVDPSDDTYDMYRAFLLPRRYIVEHARSGAEALAKAASDPPDVIVSEIRLPGLDGFALCQQLRREPTTRDVPIVVLTCDARAATADSAWRAGADSVLVKPCLPDKLLGTLQQLEDGGRRQRRQPVDDRLRRGIAEQRGRWDRSQ